MKRGEFHLVFAGAFATLALAHALAGHWSQAIPDVLIATLSVELWGLKRGRA